MSERLLRIALCADGRSPHTSRWANWFADRGHTVTVVWRPEQLEGTARDSYRPAVAHVPGEPAPIVGRPDRIRGARSRLRALGRRLDPDLVHGLFLQYHGWTARDLCRRPLVLSALGSDAMALGAPLPPGWKAALAERIARRRTIGDLRAADALLCDSEAIGARLRAAAPGVEPVLVRFGVERRSGTGNAGARWRERLGIEPDQPVVLSTRLVRPLYNIDVLVRAFAAVVAQVPRAVLVLKELERLGDPEYRRSCLELADRLGIAASTRVVGELPRDELLALYAAADVCVSIPSTDGMAVSVLEAMAAGVAVVAADSPGIDRRVLRHAESALLVPVGRHEPLAAAIVRVIADEGLGEKLRAEGRSVVAEVGDFDTELNLAEQLYRDLIVQVARRERRIQVRPAEPMGD
jgi:L-malate glycosyltransferase